MNSPVSGTPRVLLRLEAMMVLIAAIAGYRELGASWALFAVALLIPDVALVAYTAGPRVGAAVYNAFHSYIAPATLAAVAYVGSSPLVWAVCLIWIAHIGWTGRLDWD